MSTSLAEIPAGSQTVGPYFRIGLEGLIDRAPALTLDMPGTIEVRGRVLDRDGVPVPDAMLEFWSAATLESATSDSSGFPEGFRRVATSEDGSYKVVMFRPAVRTQGIEAPNMVVLVFARGLLRHLISRVYLEDEQANATDGVLAKIPQQRRATLIARRVEARANSYGWDVILQGRDETVFFAW